MLTYLLTNPYMAGMAVAIMAGFLLIGFLIWRE